jgi:hypothetical protein
MMDFVAETRVPQNIILLVFIHILCYNNGLFPEEVKTLEKKTSINRYSPIIPTAISGIGSCAKCQISPPTTTGTFLGNRRNAN